MAAGPSEASAASVTASYHAPDYELTDVNTKAFNVGSFGSLWREKLKKMDLALDIEEEVEMGQQLVDQLGLPADMVEELQVVCGVNTLDCSEDTPDTDVIPQDTDLVTLQIRKKVIEKREERLICDRTCRQEMFAHEHEMQTVGRKPSNPENFVPAGEIILTINVYSPVIFTKHREKKPHHTMLVLGSQKLTELRDAISCVSDLQIGGEFSNTPDLAPEHISKDLYKSAFFFFEETFYNDLRYSECRDLSRTIIDWVESHDRGYGKFRTAKMEDYTFNDMCIKVGYPYLYCHQGDCEHLVIITDIRVVHHDDCLDKTLYPCVIKKPWMWTRKCSVCKLFIVRWVTNNDSFAPEDPCFFCDTCFRMLHYDTDGNKLGEFLAYPYVDPGIFN
ncbi:snRNA-activating protein complex subunit 3 isoform X1 [Pristis pectinata]|uniref:snRNA-activating protein complex subunit 3 isoform X1 n=1 Tax=Pristis pectinata TaxID=685728 RepID=UPI00223E1409|nr:snRNA-activating protein complex subunit 3 isoform X1 [Pristis pectinata]